jgi:hypothetical protein
MKTTSIHIEGQIISPEIFDRLESNEISYQLPQDFGFAKGIRLKDEIAAAWADAKDQWNIFKRRIEKISPEESGTTETRKFWIVPLLEFLGYNLSLSKAEEVNGNSFAISHRASNLDGFPAHIVGCNDSLDRRKDKTGPRLSPHALIQEYLNITEHLYGIVTNGYQLRLLRDSGKLIRLTYLEFDLLQMMEDDLFAEFSIMYRLIHSSRMPQKFGEGDASIIEQYHQLSLEAGARIREKLSIAVEKSIMTIANGFLKHPANDELRSKIRSKEIDDEKFYQYLLRFIYRVLFLMVLEERDIIYPNKKDERSAEADKLDYLRDIYYNFYSITRIRKLSENIFFFDEKLEDLWIALRNTFKIFGDERLASKLGIYPLNGDLFDYGSIGILSDSNLDNHSLLECVRNLSLFENPETKTIIRVNYAALNVEEFGSVYEGLLEQKPTIYDDGNEIRFGFEKGSERSSSGSHYTPEELVQPLIKHSLDYVIEDKLKNTQTPPFTKGGTKGGSDVAAKEQALLSIKVCDVACGSGHILLSAARRIAQELTKVRTGEDQPAPEPYRQAIRDVINHCIYGVDKNPLAVELCKVALWLEAHNPGMPLNFLDHKIKCGDSIVGLARIEELQNGIATEAFKTLPGDDKDIAASFRRQNKTDISNRSQYTLTDNDVVIEKLNKISVKFKSFNSLPDNTVEAVKKKSEEFDVLRGEDWWSLKQVADLQVAQFFIQKTLENKDFLVTDKTYFRIFAGERAKHERQISTARAVAAKKKFFHWFLEFPEVFSEGGLPGEVPSNGTKTGFDCILGNPPFLGGQRLSGTFGDEFLNWVKSEYAPAGSCDLVTYFFRRIYELLRPKGFQALLATNTIAQGNAREGGLDVIINNGGNINFAIRSMRWPGVAAVEVSLVSIYKGDWKKERFLGHNKVYYLSAYLDDTRTLGNPSQLKQNEGKSFQGTTILGDGFLVDEIQAKKLLSNKDNEKVLYKFLNGEDLNTGPEQKPNRWAINFFNWDENYCKDNFPECFDIIYKSVKPMREKITYSKNAKEKWWQYERFRPELYETINGLTRVMVIAQTSKTVAFCFVPNGLVYGIGTIVVSFQTYDKFAVLQSTMHNHWVWKYASTMKSDLRYAPTEVFETYPFPQNLTKETEAELEKIGLEYHEFRRQLMLDMQLGLTKTYNLFHNPQCSMDNVQSAMDIREFKSAKLQIPMEEAIQRIEKLRALHKQMDEAVLKAYGWIDINLAHDFYEVDYLPENDRIRYTISPEARKEILKRLLELNHKIHAEEVAKGLWEKKGKKKTKASVVKEKQINYGQEEIFGE